MRTGTLRIIIPGIIVVILIVTALIMFGCDKKGERDPKRLSPEFVIEKMADRLKLSEVQVDSLRTIQEETRIKRDELFGNFGNGMGPMMFFDIVIEGEIKHQDFDEKTDIFRDKMLEMDRFTAGQMLKVHYLLSEEQRQKLSEHIQEFSRKRYRNKGKRENIRK